MPLHEVTVITAISRLENDCLLGRALFFPEISACGTEASEVRRELAVLARGVIERESPWMLHRRMPTETPRIREIAVDEPRPIGQTTWLDGVSLRFEVVVWRHGDDAIIGWVPELDIDVIAADDADLDRRLPGEIRRTLLRMHVSRQTGSMPWLAKLLWLQRHRETTVTADTIIVDVRSPREIVEDARDVRPPDILPHVADRLEPETLKPAHEVESLVAAISEHLLNDRPRSVLLVGPPGVGKTAVFHQFIRDQRRRLGARRCWATSGARLVAGMLGYGSWQQRCQSLRDEAIRTEAILHLGNAIELVEVGRTESTGESVGDFLQPAIARGELVVLLEATPEQARVLERDHPRVSAALVRLDVPEPGSAVARRVFRRVADGRVDEDVLDLIDRLHRRFATYSAYPGRPLGFLQRLIDDAIPGCRPRPKDVTQAFSRETGLPLLFLDEAASLDMETTRDWIDQRVMGQRQAVDLVVNLLATIKAGLGRPGRPIASLLFVGPTGVGKTQMAKTLAEFLYRSPDRMTRIDMSEYADPLAVERLVGGLRGEGLLTARIREQPFGVILLDEFEKAHPCLFDLLLQILGDGRITDAGGRIADCRNAVVVMTSNLGCDSFGTAPTGFTGSSRDAEGHFTDAVRRSLRPELFNRIDRIVPFLPLAPETVVKIADRELELIRGRDGIRDRGIDLDLQPDVAAVVARRGFDARYGARPIKRAVERLVLTPLAAAINAQAGGRSLRMAVRIADAADSSGFATTVSDGAVRADVSTGSAGAAGRAPTTLRDLAVLAAWCRRNGESLATAYPLARMRNELFLARRRHRVTDPPSGPTTTRDWESQGKSRKHLERIADSLARVDAWTARSRQLELRVLRCYHGVDLLADGVIGELLEHSRSLQTLLESLYAHHGVPATDATIALFSESPRAMRRAARAYLAVAARRGLLTEVHAVTVGHPLARPWADETPPWPLPTGAAGTARREPRQRGVLIASRLLAPVDFLMTIEDARDAAKHAALVGLLLSVSGFPAAQLFTGEAGLHTWHGLNETTEHCRVDIHQGPLAAYTAPFDVDRRGGTGSVPACRDYRWRQMEVVDHRTKRRFSWSDTDLDNAHVTRLFTEHNFLTTILKWLLE